MVAQTVCYSSCKALGICKWVEWQEISLCCALSTYVVVLLTSARGNIYICNCKHKGNTQKAYTINPPKCVSSVFYACSCSQGGNWPTWCQPWLFTAKPSSYHVHSTLQVTPPTFLCPTLSVNAEPARLFCAVHSMM